MTMKMPPSIIITSPPPAPVAMMGKSVFEALEAVGSTDGSVVGADVDEGSVRGRPEEDAAEGSVRGRPEEDIG